MGADPEEAVAPGGGGAFVGRLRRRLRCPTGSSRGLPPTPGWHAWHEWVAPLRGASGGPCKARSGCFGSMVRFAGVRFAIEVGPWCA